MKFIILLIAALSFLGTQIFAYTNGKLFIEGTVKSFTEQVVKLQVDKTVLSVPRKSVPISDLRVGTKIKVELSKSELSSLKHEP